jgi:hypothetical protein
MPEAFKAWLNSGARNDDVVPNEPLFDAIHVKLNGEIFLYVDGYTPAGPLHGTFFTIGSGRKYAYGALMCGKSPAEAVEITAQCDPFCGGPVAQLPLFETTCSNLQAA